MKSFILSLAMTMFPFFTFAGSYDKLWKQVEQYEEDGKPKSAYDVVEKILKKATGAHHTGQALSARLKMVALQQEWAPDSFFTEIQKLEALRANESRAEAKAVYASLLAEVYAMNRDRSQASGLELTSSEMKEWTREEYDSASAENWRRSMQDLPLLAKARSKDWLPFIDQEKQSAYFNHDLLHILWNRAQKQDENIWEGTRHTLASLAQDVAAEYKRIGNREAALLVSLDWVGLQSDERESDLLRKLVKEYGDLPVCAEAYLQLCGNVKVEEAIELARECIRRYPKYERIGEVQNKLNSYLQPSLRWSGRSIYYPGKEYSWTLTSSNAQRLTFELLRMPKTFKKSKLSGNKENVVQQLRKLGTPVKTFSYDLPTETPWDVRKDVVAWTAPEIGRYALIITGEASEQDILSTKVVEYSTFICSRLQPLIQNGLGQQRTVVVDAESGQPIEGATVEYYDYKDNEIIILGTATTDHEGRAVLDNDKIDKTKSTYIFRKVSYGDDDYLDPAQQHFSRYSSNRPEAPFATVSLYSDRAIYRPGQNLHIGGIVYYQEHWDATVQEEIPLELTLRDANGKEVGTASVTTDEMGKFSADFMLPQGGLPGRYRVQALAHVEGERIYNSLSIRVEEYKRPTFDVTMDKAPDMQWPADSITLTGKAMGYNGVPIREGRVTGTYQFVYPYWWWRRDSRRDSEPMPIDTVTTDQNGCFSICVPLTKLTEEALWGGLNLELNVAVNSIAGETHEASTRVPLSKRPLRIVASVPQQQEREHLKPVTMELLTSTGRPTDGTIKWTIYPASEEKRTSDVAVSSGVITSKDKQLSLDAEVLRALEAGQYELFMEASAGENTDSLKAYFLIFGMDDTKLPKVTPNWLYCPDSNFGPDKPARLQVGSSFTDVAFYYTIVANYRVVEEHLIQLSDELRVIEIPYDESYGDGATFHYAFVKGGKVYKENETLHLVQPDRTLRWEWKTFRDRLHPGDKETWTLQLRKPDGTPAPAQVMATLYDASLDALTPHAWNLVLRRYYNITSLPWEATDYYSSYYTSSSFNFPMKTYDADEMEFDHFNEQWYEGFSFRSRHYGWRRMKGEPLLLEAPMLARASVETLNESSEMVEDAVANEAAEGDTTETGEGASQVTSASPAVRTNFNETAAFLPRLQANAKGEVSITFTLPESLTTWRLLGLAHTKDMMSTTFEAEAIARKEMMARLFLPRFLRAEDQASVRATIQNLTEAEMAGTALLEIFDPETERVIMSQKKPFTATANGECLLTFDYTPSGDQSVVAVRLTADSKTFSDGEQHYLPILPNKSYVTESVEIRADSLGTFTTDLTSLFNHDSATATNRRLTVEYTTHPIWYALQALPSLIEPKYDDIISLSISLQAQALATYIANTTPRLKDLVEIWKREQAQGQPSLASRLAQDEELKQLILDETPWLREAENEADRKERLIQLFNISLQENTLTSIAQRMERRLEPEGGYSWFPGMPCSELMTRVIATELTRLRTMTHDFQTLPSAVQAIVNHLLTENVSYIAGRTAKYIKDMKEWERKGETVNTASLMYLEYVYVTQHAGVKLSSSQKEDVKYLLDHMKGSVAGMDNWERATAAIVMQGANRKKEARQYYESLLEHTTTTSDHGTFFDYAGGSFNPTSHKIIHHVAAMEAVQVMEPNNQQLLKGLRRWLLQQKRTQMWESNICTADAIYALLLGNEEAIKASAKDEIHLNYAQRKVEVTRKEADQTIAGLGFIKKQYADGEAPKSITVKRNTDSEAWGAVFATYLTPMTDASAAATGLSVRCEQTTMTPKVGDRITVRYVITADRDYEYVNLRAPRAACAEPSEQLSGYCWQGGLGYYRAVRDAHTDYFFDTLPKGTYVLEESAYIDRSGRYTSGLTTIRCLYAPEYGGHTPAVELTVE